jgi:hypothetical protein
VAQRVPPLPKTAEKEIVSPPLKPVDKGPSLEVTTKFIQDKLNSFGVVSFMTFGTQTTDNSPFSHRWTFELSKIRANPADCSIRYHEKVTLDGKSPLDGDTKPLAKWML